MEYAMISFTDGYPLVRFIWTQVDGQDKNNYIAEIKYTVW
jgi:hypothetical protein